MTSPAVGLTNAMVGAAVTMRFSEVFVAVGLLTLVIFSLTVLPAASPETLHGNGDCAVDATTEPHVLPSSTVYSIFTFGFAVPPVAQTMFVVLPAATGSTARGITIHAAGVAVSGSPVT